jgi:8-amino-7-oxononanoate synthase
LQTATLESAVGAEIVIDSRRYINFGGSSYLGLSGNPEILEAGMSALRQCGSGAPLARFHRVLTRAHQDVESEACDFFSSPAALYLASGYFFGLVSMAALRGQFDTIFFDEFSHHSLREAIAASGLTNHAFRHLDAEDLRARLKEHLRAGARPLVATDGLFSTLGEIAPLDELASAIAPYDGRLLVDESHAFGVLGALGRGAAEHHCIPPSLVLVGGSLGKAFGTCGGIVPASEDDVRAFRTTPGIRGASVGLPAAAAMCARSLNYVRRHPELLQRLRDNVAYMKARLRKIGLEVGDSIAPVAAFRTRANRSPAALKDALLAEGIFVFHSSYIGAGADGVIRCGIFADHTHEHIDALVGALRALL